MKYLFLLTIVSIFAAQGYAQIADIIDLHHNDANGVPAAPYNIGSSVTIEGIVTCGTNVYSSSNFEIYLQDATAGVNAFQYQSMPADVNVGDRLRIRGKIAQYRGLTEVSDIIEVKVLERNLTPPPPLMLTCKQLDNSFAADFSEPNEGRLVRINNVHVVSESQPLYTIADESGQCLLYIDPDTKLDVPPGAFSVIGVLKQYDSSAPYTDGYEISPRFASDFILGDGPEFIKNPREIRITSESVVVEWQTKAPASARLFYARRGEALPSEGIVVPDETIRHEITLPELQPATIYQLVVEAVDASGARLAKPLLFSTASSESSGDIKVYFSKNVDRSVRWKTVATGGVDLSTIMIERINNAQYSIDAALYNLTHDKIFQALFLARSRGVSIRLVYESENDNDNIKWLRDAGVPVIYDTFGSNGGQGYMHNKFFIIDARDASTGADDWVVTGSANASYYGTKNNAENLLAINDQALAAAYTLEFNEMWGSETETPNATASRIGSRKTDNTPHRFNIGGVWVEQYMSPSDDTEDKIIDAIETADRGLFFCIFSFTSDGIEDAMKQPYLRDPNFMVRGVFDAGSVNNTGSPFGAMLGQGARAWSRPADIFADTQPHSLHHKYLLIDGPFRDSHPLVVNGSHNWSYSANSRNDENTLVIYDADITNQFYQEFCARYKEAGGQGDVTVKVAEKNEMPRRFRLLQNYPNPFNSKTIIKAVLPEAASAMDVHLQITDVLGRRIAVLHGLQHDAEHLWFLWDGHSQIGEEVSSGIYLASLTGTSATQVIKLLYIR